VPVSLNWSGAEMFATWNPRRPVMRPTCPLIEICQTLVIYAPRPTGGTGLPLASSTRTGMSFVKTGPAASSRQRTFNVDSPGVTAVIRPLVEGRITPSQIKYTVLDVSPVTSVTDSSQSITFTASWTVSPTFNTI